MHCPHGFNESFRGTYFWCYFQRQLMCTKPVPLFKTILPEVLLVSFLIPIITYAIQRPSSNLHSKILLVLFPRPIIIYAYQRPSSKPLPKVLLVPFLIPIITYAIQRPSSNVHSKYYWYYSQRPIIIYAYQRPSSNPITQSIIGTTPTDDSLR